MSTLYFYGGTSWGSLGNWWCDRAELGAGHVNISACDFPGSSDSVIALNSVDITGADRTVAGFQMRCDSGVLTTGANKLILTGNPESTLRCCNGCEELPNKDYQLTLSLGNINFNSSYKFDGVWTALDEGSFSLPSLSLPYFPGDSSGISRLYSTSSTINISTQNGIISYAYTAYVVIANQILTSGSLNEYSSACPSSVDPKYIGKCVTVVEAMIKLMEEPATECGAMPCDTYYEPLPMEFNAKWIITDTPEGATDRLAGSYSGSSTCSSTYSATSTTDCKCSGDAQNATYSIHWEPASASTCPISVNITTTSPNDTNEALIAGGLFSGAYSRNDGNIDGACTFSGQQSRNQGVIQGYCTFSGQYSRNIGQITGDCLFSGQECDNWEDGVINGNCTFSGWSSINNGTINGNCIFSGTLTKNYLASVGGVAVVNGNCIFSGSQTANSYGAVVNGDCTFSGDNSTNFKASVNGNCEFSGLNSSNNVDSVIHGNCTFSGENSMNWRGSVYGCQILFSGKNSANHGQVYSECATDSEGVVDEWSCEFSGEGSHNNGYIGGACEFSGLGSYNVGNINGTGLFSGENSYTNSGSISGSCEFSGKGSYNYRTNISSPDCVFSGENSYNVGDRINAVFSGKGSHNLEGEITGNCEFSGEECYNGALGSIRNQRSVSPSVPGDSTFFNGWVGFCEFSGKKSHNDGTIHGTGYFSGEESYNSGEINGLAFVTGRIAYGLFSGSGSYNTGVIDGGCRFIGNGCHNDGTIMGLDQPLRSEDGMTIVGSYTINCSFEGEDNYNSGTINCYCDFLKKGYNSGTINAACDFFEEASYNTGTINGKCHFYKKDSYNEGDINCVECLFDGENSYNSGTITCTYNGPFVGYADYYFVGCTFQEKNSYNEGTITGGCKFISETSYNSGTVNGSCSFLGTEGYNSGTINGPCGFIGADCVNGLITTPADPAAQPPVEAVIDGLVNGDCTFSGANTNNIGEINGDCVFSGEGTFNSGIITGDCDFVAAESYTSGTITGDCAFIGSATYNSGTINGICTFLGEDSVNGTITTPADPTANPPVEEVIDGTINGNCFFTGVSSNNIGTINGNCTFSGDTASNNGSIYGDCNFTTNTRNNLNITGDCLFSMQSVNTPSGTIHGDCSFNDSAYNDGTIYSRSKVFISMNAFPSQGQPGQVYVSKDTNTAYLWDGSEYAEITPSPAIAGGTTFNDTSYNNNTVNGDSTFNDASRNLLDVTGNCIFNNTSYNDGEITGDCSFYATSHNLSLIVGDCVFNEHSYNCGQVTGDCIFNDESYNCADAGLIIGNCTFNDLSYNGGGITGNATFTASTYTFWPQQGTVSGIITFSAQPKVTFIFDGDFEKDTTSCIFSGGVPFFIFNDHGRNLGKVAGDATFNDYSCNLGVVSGDATFNDYSYNGGSVLGDGEINDYAYNIGSIEGNVTYSASAFNKDPKLGSIAGTLIFSSNTPAVFTLSENSVWTSDTTNWVFNTPTPTWIFNDSSRNEGKVTGNAVFSGNSFTADPVKNNVTGSVTFSSTSRVTFILSGASSWTSDITNWIFPAGQPIFIFNDYSYNSGKIVGDAVFNNSSYNRGQIVGSGIFNNSSYLDVGSVVTGNVTLNNSAYLNNVATSVVSDTITYNGTYQPSMKLYFKNLSGDSAWNNNLNWFENIEATVQAASAPWIGGNYLNYDLTLATGASNANPIIPTGITVGAGATGICDISGLMNHGTISDGKFSGASVVNNGNVGAGLFTSSTFTNNGSVSGGTFINGLFTNAGNISAGVFTITTFTNVLGGTINGGTWKPQLTLNLQYSDVISPSGKFLFPSINDSNPGFCDEDYSLCVVTVNGIPVGNMCNVLGTGFL